MYKNIGKKTSDRMGVCDYIESLHIYLLRK